MPGRNIKRPLNQTPMQQHVDRHTQDLGSTPKIQMTCSEEDRFNESTITLLSRQKDLQKQSLYMMQNMTRWNEYDNLMRFYYIWLENMDLADWPLQIKSGFIDKYTKIWIGNSKVNQYPI